MASLEKLPKLQWISKLGMDLFGEVFKCYWFLIKEASPRFDSKPQTPGEEFSSFNFSLLLHKSARERMERGRGEREKINKR